MEQDVITYRGILIAIFNGTEENLEWLYELQDTSNLNKTDLILVAWEGSDDPKLDSDKFIIENREASLINHFMWEDLFSEEEQKVRLFEMIDNFIDNKEQVLIENYEFVEDEPFYDYSGGRDENR